MLISIIVLSNMSLLTIKYFHFPSEIKMSVKNNNEDNNYPLITLSTVVHNYSNDLFVYAHWKEYLSHQEFNMTEKDGKSLIENKLD